jgi:hypothetical protein
MAALGLTAAGVGATMLSSAPTFKVPDITPANTMPVQDSDAIMETRRKAMVAQQQRQGRASTMLSQNNDALGG